MEKQLFDLVPLVTTPLSLVAFLGAAVVLMHARTIRRAESLIRTAPEASRATLVAGALDILDVQTKNLTREQRFELALEILSQRRHRNVFVFILSLSIALAFAVAAIYSFVGSGVRRGVETVLAAENREAVMPILNRSGIFEAADRGVVEYLAAKVTLSDGERAHLTAKEQDRIALARYNALPSVRELRQRAERRLEPFAITGEAVTATVPDRVDHPRQFFVHVPIDSKYANRPVKIASAKTDRYIRVFARAAIDPTNNQTQVHLNREQATYLEGVFPVSGRVEVTIRETLEPIYDPNCSVEGRAKNMIPASKELCAQGDSVSLVYLQTFLGR